MWAARGYKNQQNESVDTTAVGQQDRNEMTVTVPPRNVVAMTCGLGWFGSDPAVVGRGPLAFSECMGQSASTHSFHAVERPREVWAVWRALLFPFEERAEGLQ